MASKLMFVHMMLFFGTLLAIQLKADGLLPEIHITNAVKGDDSPPINIGVSTMGSSKGSAQLKPSQSFNIRVDVNEVYYTRVTFGLKFTSFHAYEPARDKGRSAIYWKASNDGFGISYDNINWKLEAPWESE